MLQKIFIAGLTAAGKTTHAKLLASEFNLQYVSASNILLHHANLDTSMLPNDFWISSTSYTLRQQRKNDRSMDQLVDQQLILMANNKDQIVFDSWGLPWLSSTPALRIWLASSLESRWWKATISHGSDFDANAREVLYEIVQKDDDAKDYFFATYGFDIFQDHQIFDYILDITTFITAPTLEKSYISIKDVQEILSAVIRWETNYTASNKDIIKKIINKYGNSIFCKIPHELESFL